MKKIKLLELFGGIGACSKALERLGIDYEIADYVEIDKYACTSYNAIHGTNFETQDVSKWDKDIQVDMIMHGSPCQDFSLAGLGKGGDKDSGTRSSLMYETIRIVEKLKPKYIVWENVKNLISKKHKHNFDAYLKAMDQLGYTNYYKVLNAKNYGIPQNRERIFTISILNPTQTFSFPAEKPLELRLKDMLEEEVDEKFYLSQKQEQRIKTSSYIQNQRRIQEKDYADILCARNFKDPKCVRVGGIFDTDKSTHQAGSVWDKDGLSPTLDTMQGGWRQPCVQIKNNTKKGYIEATEGDGVDISNRMEYQIYDGQIATNVNASVNPYYNTPLRIRKLTPKECWRLMGFDDEDFEKAEQVCSNSQLYKQAGNSIVVNVLEAIFTNLLLDTKQEDLGMWGE